MASVNPAQAFRYPAWFLTAVVLWAGVAGCEKHGEGPPFRGQCGLRSQWVECNYDWDCSEHDWYTNTCSVWGNCYHSGRGEYWCNGLSFGVECNYPPNTFCGFTGECSPPCQTHEDCPSGICVCEWGFSLCVRFWCRDGSCPEYTHPVEGILVCAPDADILEGECQNLGESCDPGYVRVGTHGCVRVE